MISPRLAAIYEQERLCGPFAALPEICIGFRMAINGASDPWTDKEITDVLAMLKKRIETWEPTLCRKDDRMDEAVRELVLATIEYVEVQKL